MQFWDTAGQETFRSMSNVFYKNCHGVVLCYDITNKESYEHLSHWTNELLTNMEQVPTLMLGNKNDLNNERKVTVEEAKDYAKKNGFLFNEVSALVNENNCVVDAISNLIDGRVISYYG